MKGGSEMTQKYCDTMLKVRVPGTLARAVDTEARRQMLSKSAWMRRVMARELGLMGKVSTPTDNRRDLRSD